MMQLIVMNFAEMKNNLIDCKKVHSSVQDDCYNIKTMVPNEQELCCKLLFNNISVHYYVFSMLRNPGPELSHILHITIPTGEQIFSE